MHRRAAATLALALLIAVPIAPVNAAPPVAVPPVASAAPDPTPAPSADPTAGPSAQPSSAPSEAPSADPSAAPSASPVASGDPSPSAGSPTDAPGSASPAPSDEAPTPAVPDAGTASPAASGEPSASPSAAPGKGKAGNPPGLTADDRYIVILRDGTSVAAAVDHAARGQAVKADRTFSKAVRGYAAKLDARQLAALKADRNVQAIIRDEVVRTTAQYIPLGVKRIGGLSSSVARIDGVDQRVDADVAVVDTGIDGANPDLNVVGGYNCSTSDPTLWRDVHGHGTHVAGTIGAKDNGSGVVGVAPGVRMYAVKILNDDGNGLLSWYVCGLDWIAKQRDPNDPSRPLFEAVNMSVGKDGRDDHACGSTNSDILHAAICRLVASGVTVVAAAGNEASAASTMVPAAYDEVITVSALADTDGRAGGLGGSLCYSWGTYDVDDTFASFSNYGWDVDLIAPGKCIWSTLPGNRYGYSSGTSMATPHVTGAAALYKASRPLATPAEVKQALQLLGNLNWATGSDPDAYHEKLLDVSRIAPLGDFSVEAGTPSGSVGESGGLVRIPVSVVRSSGFFETVTLSASAPAGFNATLSSAQLLGTTSSDASVTVSVPAGTPDGRYSVVVSGRNWDRVRSTTATIVVEGNPPTAYAPLLVGQSATTFNTSSMVVRAAWPAAKDASGAIAGYEIQWSVDGGAWGGTASLPGTTRTATRTMLAGHTYAARVRARDGAGNWSAWAASGSPYRFAAVQDSSSAIKRSGTWYRYAASYTSGGTAMYAKYGGASVTLTLSGRGFALVMPKGPTRGQARVYLDGTYIATISLYRSSGLSRQLVLARSWATTQTRTVKVVLVGTSGRPRVDLDAIVVLK